MVKKLAFLLFLLASSAGAAVNNYYVSTTGVDTGARDGLSPAQAWRTLTYTDANMVLGSTGTIVHVEDGTYANEAGAAYGSPLGCVTLGRTTTAVAPITYISDNKWGAKLTCSTRDFTVEIKGSALSEGNYYTFDGFEIPSGYGGIITWKSYNTFQNLKIHDLNPECHASLHGEALNVGQGPSGSGMPNGSEGNIARNNIIYNIGGAWPASQTATASGTPCTAYQQHGIYFGYGTGGLVYNNTVANVDSYGIHLHHRPNGARVYNNTVAYAGGAYELSNDGTISLTEDVVFSNNIGIKSRLVHDFEEGQGTIGTGVIVSNNICFGATGGCEDVAAAGATVTNMTTVDPLLVSVTGTATPDLNLTGRSPARNTGTTVAAVTTDLAGVARPQSNNYDIGAYEVVPTTYYTKPSASGTGTCLSVGNACTNATVVTKPVGSGDTIELQGTNATTDGLYQGNSARLDWFGQTAIAGASGDPITIRCQTAPTLTTVGGCLIETQNTGSAFRLRDGQAWIDVDGIMFSGGKGNTCGTSTDVRSTIEVGGSAGNVHDINFTKISAWGPGLQSNATVIHIAGADTVYNITFDQFTADGPARKTINSSQNGTGPNWGAKRFKRGWANWGGSMNMGPKMAGGMMYNTGNIKYADMIFTMDGFGMLSSYTLKNDGGEADLNLSTSKKWCPDPPGTCQTATVCGTSFTGFGIDQGYAHISMDRLDTPLSTSSQSSVAGAILITQVGDHSPGQAVFAGTNSNLYFKDVNFYDLTYVREPSATDKRMFNLASSATLSTNNTVTNSTKIRATQADIIGSAWVFTNGGSAASGPVALADASTYRYDHATGASKTDNCYRHNVETGASLGAGNPAWPFLLSVQANFLRTRNGYPALNIQSKVESLLGQIPSQCGGAGGPTPTNTPSYTPSLTPTITNTPTRTFTRTFTPTNTFTPTLPPTNTPPGDTATPTFTRTNTPTITNTPPPTFTPGVEQCIRKYDTCVYVNGSTRYQKTIEEPLVVIEPCNRPPTYPPCH